MAESSGSVVSNVSNNLNAQKQSSAVQSTDPVDEDKTDKVMLLEDFNYMEETRTVSNLLEFFEQNKLNPSKNDILVGLVYILMLESGFVPLENKHKDMDYSFSYQRVLRLSKYLPDNWKKDNIYSYTLVLPPFTLYECKMAFIVVAEDLLVNCVIKGVEDGQFNIILDPLTYFISSHMDMKFNKLQNLRSLSRYVKSEICYPAKQVILWNNNIVRDCLQALPPEILLLIMNNLQIEDIVHLGQCNSFFYNLMKTPKLWINRLRNDFQENCASHTYEELRNCYKHRFTIRNFRNRHRRFW